MRNTMMILGLVLLLAGSARADLLFNQGEQKSGTLASEKKARFEVGALITVQVFEEVTATTQSDTKTKKEAEVSATADAGANNFITNLGISKNLLPNWGIEAENESKATGSTKRSSTLRTVITCTVKKVQPDGNLFIEGEKTVTVNREDTTFIVSGIVRPKDVTPANTIVSTQMANVNLKLKGQGPLWNNQRRGFITKLLDWFSPF